MSFNSAVSADSGFSDGDDCSTLVEPLTYWNYSYESDAPLRALASLSLFIPIDKMHLSLV